jgi:hypothetical protein
VPLLLRLAAPAFVLGALLVIVTVSLGHGIGPLYFVGVALVGAGILGQTLRGRRQKPLQEHPPLEVAAPVSGRWRALNSPATKVPSHIHQLAQTYAIDVTHEPEGAAPRRLDALWPPMRRPEAFPSFGRPVLAPFDGEVIAVRGTSRDHLTRMSWPGLVYMLLEGFVRSLGAPRHLLGNHVLLRATGPLDGGAAAEGAGPTGGERSPDCEGSADGEAADGVPAGDRAADGVVAVLAHLRRGSLRVRVGQRVRAGEVLAECGNSGNSSDPHVHFQLMDGPDIETAHGLPFAWTYRDGTGAVHRGLPADAELFEAPQEPSAPRSAPR